MVSQRKNRNPRKDWDSTSVSDGSTTVPDYHARCLRRALDQKVRKLRSMLTADEDITTELDQVVCRLMKLALRTSKGRNTPPPTRWMQCKLLDLLTLTEKTIERRKRHFIESYPLKTINYEEKSQEMIALEKIKEDDTALRIVDRYRHLVNQTDDINAQYRYLDFDLEDDLSVTSNEFAKDYDFIEKHPKNPNLLPKATLPVTEIFQREDVAPQGESKLQRTQAWVEEDIEVVPYPMHDGNFDNSSVDTDHNTSKFTKYFKKRFKGKQCIELNCVIRKKSHSKGFKLHRTGDKSKENSKTKMGKKMFRKKSCSNSSGVHTTHHNTFVSVDCRTYRVKSRKKQHKNLCPTVAKPIPVSLIELCHPEIMTVHDIGPLNPIIGSMTMFSQNKTSYVMETEIAATKESKLIEIITENAQETIALQRTIGTDADADSIFEDETLIRSVSNTLLNEDDVSEKHNIATENVHSQTIFLYDIDEPTTSKGIRHIGMDVQCGPDATAAVYSMLSATTSLTRVPKMFTAGIRIGDSATDTKITSTDFGTCTYEADNNYKTIIPRNRSVGIKIKDSYSNIIVNRMELSTVSTYLALSASTSLTKMPKILTAGIKLGDSKTDNRIKNPDFRAGTNTPERNYNSFFPTETFVGINIKDSLSIIPKQLEYSTDTDKPFDYKTDTSKVATIFESSPLNSLIKGPDKNLSLKMDSSTNTQELYDKLIASSQELFNKESEIFEKPYIASEIKDFSSNLPNRIEYPIKSYEKSNSLSNQIFKKQTTPKGTQKKTVDFQLQEPVSHIPKRVICLTTAEKPCDNPSVYSQKKTSKTSIVIPLEKSVPQRSDSDSKQTESRCLTDTEISRISTRSPPSISKQTRLIVTKLEEISIGIKTEDNDTNIKEKSDCIMVTQEVNGRSNVSQPFPEETVLLQSQRQLKTEDSTSNICASVESATKTLTCNTLDNSNLHVVSAASSGLSVAKNVKRTLCSDGVQVHSYRDKHALSEDIMYQGQWQQNKTKVLARRKWIPVINKKKDLNLKKKVNSKELVKSSTASSNERNRNNNKVKNALKPVLRQPLVPRNTIITNLRKDSFIRGNKQEKNHPNTTCVATIAKPFRNILKVPSKFPISNLPSKKPKSLIVKRTPITPILPVNKDEKTIRKGIKKNYIPPYLRQRGLNSANKISKTDLNLSLDSAISKTKKSEENIRYPLIRSQTEEIKRDLLKFRTKPLQPDYVVFRNEIEKKKSDGQTIKNTSETVRKKDVCRRRSSTPTSANSSTCSSPCSIATVRAVTARTKNVTNRRHSSSSYINNTPNSGSENSTPERNRKLPKRCKSAKGTVENKENIPQTSNRQNSKLGKAIFMGQKKNVYISQVKDSLQSTANTPSKHKNQKSNLNIPTTKSFTDKKSSPFLSPSLLSNKASVMLDASLSTTRSNEISECAQQTSNMVLIIEPQPRQLNIPTDLSKLDDTNNVNHYFVNVAKTDKEVVDSPSVQNINSTMRELLNDTLGFIDDPLDDEYTFVSDMVEFNSENLAPHVDSSSSPTSFKTVVTSDDNNEVLPSDIEYALNRSFDTTLGNESILSLTDTHFTVTDFDGLSFKSMTSGSKLSGYLSADTEFSSSIKLPKCIPAPNTTSVCEIFERKDQPLQPAQNQNTTSALANQAFSGFSINEDSVAGDKPDLVNLIDSETGSLLAVAIQRQATSEELLISGRSSESFESCVPDDDSVVPNWLFQLISQQASSLNELEPPAELMVPLPIVEPLFDDNANVMEAPGAGAGAGDGRGIHSDHSQDSSGRGTSVSSSETSSGPQSEVILIDPAAFAAQFELMREAVEGSVVLAINNPEASGNATGSRQVPGLQGTEPQSFSGGESRRMPRTDATSASDADADADVSSLDTDDVPDSSDN